jgi:ribonuclease HI
MSNSFYAVCVGRVPGVYITWDDCRAQVNGYPKCKYKKFSTVEEAEAFVLGGDGDKGKDPPLPITRTRKRKRAVDGYEYDDGVVAEAKEKAKAKEAASCDDDEWAGKRAIEVYTDGATPNNQSNATVGGVGVYFGPEDPRNVSERVEDDKVTNNRCELLAITRALEVCLASEGDALGKGTAHVVIHTDSMLCINSLTQWRFKWEACGWKKASGEPVKNVDLMKRACALLDAAPLKGAVSFRHVRGHAGVPGNEAADGLATRAAT